MAFTNNFNNKKSEFNFKDTLFSNDFNIFLKQPSLINYSLVDVLNNYYNIFEIDPNRLIEINILLSDNVIQKYIENSLLNFMYQKLFDNNIIQDIEIKITDGDINFPYIISFISKTPVLDKNNPINENEKKIYVDQPLIASYDKNKGISLYHKEMTNIYDNQKLGLESNIDNLWGKTIKIPYLETNYNGHIVNAKNIEFTVPNPQDMIELYNDNITPGSTFNVSNINRNSNGLILKKDIIIVFSYTHYTGSYTNTSVNKFLNNYIINNYYNNSSHTMKLFLDKGSANSVSAPDAESSFIFSIYYNVNDDILQLTLLDSFSGRTIDYSNYSNMKIKVYGIEN